MTVKMTFSLPDDVGAFLRSRDNASAYAATVLRRAMIAERLREHPAPDWDDDFGRASSATFFGAESGT
ncbi:hypothetical protein JJV70_10675 [Streptomyces sp. JJ66]|uniref:hypothetical protein n=1 Tax=Streptomyces sp. JJ66 TaxID=2803843 RepID=UPI001C57FF76|nr:hypothetical protein [Streptomyces sp. JJ66]MBW1602561.1 hypothetical protein [Streptomyces sp. JJ66]